MIQEIIVYIILAVTIGAGLVSLWKILTGKKSSCSCSGGCAQCPYQKDKDTNCSFHKG